jgi:hypothetical protein
VIPPVQIFFKKQPITYQGTEYPVYHTASEYRQSGIGKVKGYPDPVSELVSINGQNAIHYPLTEGQGVEEYLFIHNDVVYEVMLKGNDPYTMKIAQGLNFY